MIKVYDLKCCDMTAPLAVDSKPRFSWKYESTEGYQAAFRLVITKNGENEPVWDSGYADSIKNNRLEYRGPALEPLAEYIWSVISRDSSGNETAADGSFMTGFLRGAWQGRWISACFHKKPDDSKDAPYIRKAFNLDRKPVSARLYICSPGYHNACINGEKAGNEVLSTPYTAYDRTLLYSTYDVSESVKFGENAIGVLIGCGWYNCFTKDVWNTPETSWRHIPKFIAELHIEYADGSRQVVPTDRSWKCERSPVVFNGIRNGEYYDARMEEGGWSKPGYDDSSWNPVKMVRPPGGILKAMEMEPERITSSSKPSDSWKTPEGSWIFKAAFNMAGLSEVTVTGCPGDEIIIRYSERLEEDGIHIDKRVNAGFVRSGEFQTDKYIKRSGEPETWMPGFVYHGFQFMELSGCVEKPRVVFHTVNTDVAVSGRFECSDDILNKIHKAACTATLSNLHSVPTDDPHREKNAWTGDVSLSAEQMLYNYHTVSLLRKWLADIRDSQRPDGAIPCVVPSTGWGYNWGNGPDWSSALTLIPWYIYIMTGDKSILMENYEAIKKHFSYMESQSENHIVNYGIGDWCPPFEGRAVSISMSSFKTPVEVTDTAYLFNAADIISRIAGILDKDKESSDFRKYAKSIKTAFKERFFNKDNFSVSGDCQTSTACMIYQGLSDKDEIHGLLNTLQKQISGTGYHQDTGILGNKYIYNVLGEAGRMNIALKMILNETYPSFRNWISMGATTLWECWNGEGSRNHHMFSDVSAVFYKYLAGIKPDENEPGFRHIIMKPDLNCGLEYVSAAHESPYGEIISKWKKENGYADIEISIPCGCRATLTLPDQYSESDYDAELQAGQHSFKVRELSRKESLARYYDEYVDHRNETVKPDWKIKIRDKMLYHLKTEGMVNLLEIGSGTGQDSLFFQEKDINVKAIDISEGHVDCCREKGIEAHVMDLYNMDFNDGSFDAVYTINCLLHVPKIELPSVLDEIYRVVRPGGILFIGNYSGDFEGIRKFRDQKFGRYFSFISHEGYMELLMKAGFGIIEDEKVNTDTPWEFSSFILRRK